MKKILVLEDDEKLRAYLGQALIEEGHEVIPIASLQEIQDLLQQVPTMDLFLLDRLIGNEDSKKFVPVIKQKWPAAPLLVLSAINTSVERAELLDLGADDYLGKPFSVTELTARVRALLRRSPGSIPVHLVVKNTVIDLINRQLTINGQNVSLPAKEFLLLKTMAQVPGRIFNKVDLLTIVWSSSAEIETNVLEATMTNLRKRLAAYHSEVSIKNSRNLGYWVES